MESWGAAPEFVGIWGSKKSGDKDFLTMFLQARNAVQAEEPMTVIEKGILLLSGRGGRALAPFLIPKYLRRRQEICLGQGARELFLRQMTTKRKSPRVSAGLSNPQT